QQCDRSHIHDVDYINSHQTVFHYVSHELLDRCFVVRLLAHRGPGAASEIYREFRTQRKALNVLSVLRRTVEQQT
ncbi:MAG: hypothetical protein SO151_02350, partial [Collinsella sp.]|nr:hypothetical protein [Collinsella sp.]